MLCLLIWKNPTDIRLVGHSGHFRSKLAHNLDGHAVSSFVPMVIRNQPSLPYFSLPDGKSGPSVRQTHHILALLAQSATIEEYVIGFVANTTGWNLAQRFGDVIHFGIVELYPVIQASLSSSAARRPTWDLPRSRDQGSRNLSYHILSPRA